MSASFIAYAVNFAISFFLSPYIVERVGVDAYGFIGLANNFISYAGLISISLNSMAGRFITIKIHENDIDGANRYYTSVFFANFFITAVMGVVFVTATVFLEHIINIPENIFWDVKILFALLFLNCMLGTLGSVFGVSTFATNKLYISSMRAIESNLLKVAIILPAFILFVPRVSYLGISTLACGLYAFGFNVYYMKKLLPDLSIRRAFFDIKAVIEIMMSGIWNLINRVGTLLLDGLDLLITNLLINPVSMGILSLAKSIPGMITGIIGSTVGIFSPNFTILYSQKKDAELLASVKQSMKIMGVMANLPIIILIVCGDLFFALWQPTQDATQLHILSILTCACLIFSGGINCIYNIFTVVNKLKFNSLVVISSGILSTITVFILLKTTNLGIFAVAGTSTVISIIRNFAFTAPYGAICLKQKWYALYPEILKAAVYAIIGACIGYAIRQVVFIDGWIGLVILALITLIASLLVGFFIILNREDRRVVMSKIKRRLKR